MKEIKKRENILGKISLILGIIPIIYYGYYLISSEQTSNNLIANVPNLFLIVGILFIDLSGIVMGLISLFQKVNKKIISFLGILLNLVSPFLIYICLLNSAK